MLISVWNSSDSELCCCSKMEGFGKQFPPQCCTALQEGEGELCVWITEEGTPRKARLASQHEDWLMLYAHGSEWPGSHKTVKKCYDLSQSLGAVLRWAGSSERAQGLPEGCGSAVSQARTSRPVSAWCKAAPSLPGCRPAQETPAAWETFGSLNNGHRDQKAAGLCSCPWLSDMLPTAGNNQVKHWEAPRQVWSCYVVRTDWAKRATDISAGTAVAGAPAQKSGNYMISHGHLKESLQFKILLKYRSRSAISGRQG